MKCLRKRTLALVLASVITVTGSFASENYKNTLTGLKFESSENADGINIIVQTKSAYSGNISPIRRDLDTYVITLPEVNSESKTPDLQAVSGNISSVNIRTMPYSNGSKGYTRITIKTNQQSVKFQASNQVFLPFERNSVSTTTKTKNEINKITTSQKIQQEKLELLEKRKAIAKENLEKQNISNIQAEKKPQKTIGTTDLQSNKTKKTPIEKKANKSEHLRLFLGAILIVILSAYFYLKARNRMQEIVGKDLYFEKNEIYENIGQKITKTVNKLDSTYSNKGNTVSNKNKIAEPIKNEIYKSKSIETSNIVDLDALFEEQRKNNIQSVIENEEENQALEDFLSGFSFTDELEEEQQEQIDNRYNYDENFLEKLLNSHNICFSKDEMICINKILGNEILDSTISNIEQFAHSNPISTNSSKQKLVEDLMMSYAVNQGVIFKQNDIEIFKKLINVELDMDFVTDLRTDRKRTLKMETEILLSSNELKKPSDIKTLSIKTDLPNLSEEIKKQGNNRIMSNYKPDAVYFSKGYDIKTLSVGKEIQDLVLDIYKDDLFKYKPSAKYELVDEKFLNTDIISNQKNIKIETKNVLKETSLPEEKKQKQPEPKQISPKHIEKTSPTRSQIVIESKVQTETCHFEDETLKILSSVELSPKAKCYLVKKDNGYYVLGQINKQLTKLKHYEELKSEKIQARKNEDLPDGSSRFVVRIGLNKFIINLNEKEIKYIMDLC